MAKVTADYCGCCGNGITGKRPTGNPEPLWCAHCRGHVSARPVPLWERTWFAQHGTDCPRQVR